MSVNIARSWKSDSKKVHKIYAFFPKNDHVFLLLEAKIPEESSDTNNDSEIRDEKVLDLNQIHLINGVCEKTKDEVNGSCDVPTSLMNGTDDESVNADKLCLNNDEKVKKTRKNGVHALKNIPNDEIKPEIQSVEKNEIPERNGENQ